MTAPTIDEATEDFLAHFGVKGMKWGVRTSGTGSSGGSSSGGSAGSKGSGSGGSSKAEAQAAAAKSAKRKKIAKIGGAALIAGGAVAATAMLAKNGKLNTSALTSAINAHGQKSLQNAVDQRVSNKKQGKRDLFNDLMPNFDRDVAAVSRNTTAKAAAQKAARQTDVGKRQAKLISDQLEWKKKIADVLGDLDQANAEQDAWMRSLGLGATVNNDKR